MWQAFWQAASAPSADTIGGNIGSAYSGPTPETLTMPEWAVGAGVGLAVLVLVVVLVRG